MQDPQGALIAGPPELSERRKSFLAFHRADRNFFLLFLAFCWLGVALGFAHPLNKRLHGLADYPAPAILKLHILTFSAWLALLTSQVWLVRSRRTLVHMSLGLAGFALVPVMAVSAFFSEVYSQRFYFDHQPNQQAFFVLSIFHVLAFTALATTALALRKNPAAHKRLILLATTVIVGAAYARWWGRYSTIPDTFVGMLINSYAATNLMIAAAVIYDFATRGRIHWVYQLVVPAILAGEVAVSLISHSPAWLPIARVIIGR